MKTVGSRWNTVDNPKVRPANDRASDAYDILNADFGGDLPELLGDNIRYLFITAVAHQLKDASTAAFERGRLNAIYEMEMHLPDTRMIREIADKVRGTGS